MVTQGVRILKIGVFVAAVPGYYAYRNYAQPWVYIMAFESHMRGQNPFILPPLVRSFGTLAITSTLTYGCGKVVLHSGRQIYQTILHETSTVRILGKYGLYFTTLGLAGVAGYTYARMVIQDANSFIRVVEKTC